MLQPNPASGTPPIASGRWRSYEHPALAQLFDAAFDDVYEYALALTGDDATAEGVAESAFEHVLDRLPDFEGSTRDLTGLVLAAAGEQVRRLPRASFQGRGVREALARLGPAEHEAITLRLVARRDLEAIAAATGRRPAAVVGSEVAALRSLRGGLHSVSFSLPAAQRQLDAALGRLLDGESPVQAAGSAPALADAAALLAAAVGVAGLPTHAAPPEVRARIRNHFLGAAEARRAQWVHRHHGPAVVPGLRPRPKPKPVGTGAALVLAGVLAVIAGAVLAFAANFATPSSDVYWLKRFDENVLLALTLNRVDKANLEVQISEERMREAETEAATHNGGNTVQAMRDRFSELRAAANDLGAVKGHDAHWTQVRNYYVAQASEPVDPLEHLLSSNGLRSDSDQVARLNEQFQSQRKSLDAPLGGVGTSVPGAVPSGAPNATPPPTQ